MSTRPDGGMIREGFCVTPTLNGGWLLTNIPGTGFMPVNRGAFTNDDDLIEFIIAELKPERFQVVQMVGTEFRLDADLASRIAGVGEASNGE